MEWTNSYKCILVNNALFPLFAKIDSVFPTFMDMGDGHVSLYIKISSINSCMIARFTIGYYPEAKKFIVGVDAFVPDHDIKNIRDIQIMAANTVPHVVGSYVQFFDIYGEVEEAEKSFLKIMKKSGLFMDSDIAAILSAQTGGC